MYRMKEYFDEIKNSPEKEREAKDIVCEAIEKIKKAAPYEFYDTMYRIHCVVHGPHFDEHLAKKAVAEMKNIDGTTGEHWNYEQVKSLAMQNNIAHVGDFYYAINMLYSDYSQVLGGDMGTFLKLAKAYMGDPDAPEGHVFCMWLAKKTHQELH